jgi:hypothetical protein
LLEYPFYLIRDLENGVRINLRIVCIIKKSETRSPTWSGEIFPSSANILLRKASEPKRGTASPMRRYLWPFVLKTRVTHRGLSSEGERERERERIASALKSLPILLQSMTRKGHIVFMN